jgi:hypothetical protein
MKELLILGLVYVGLYAYKNSQEQELPDHERVPTGSIVVPKPLNKWNHKRDSNHINQFHDFTQKTSFSSYNPRLKPDHMRSY